MNIRNVRRFCTAMMIFSMCIRAAAATGFDAHVTEAVKKTLTSEAFAAWMLRTELGQAVTPQPINAQNAKVWTVLVQRTEAQAAFVPNEPLRFTAQEAQAIEVMGASSYDVDKQALLLAPKALSPAQEGPRVLIVHTHSSEAYTQEEGWEYEESDTLRTSDRAHSVIRVGQAIAEQLRAQGIEVLHETSLNDYPTYSGAYERMRVTIEGYLEKYPSIQMVLDIHRDAAEDAQGMQEAFIAPDGAAQIMLVVGTDEGGLEHPNWEQNLSNALKLQALLQRQSAGSCRPIDLRTERFNAHLSAGSLLIEVGAAGNTLQQALGAAEHLSNAIGQLLLLP